MIKVRLVGVLFVLLKTSFAMGMMGAEGSENAEFFDRPSAVARSVGVRGSAPENEYDTVARIFGLAAYRVYERYGPLVTTMSDVGANDLYTYSVAGMRADGWKRQTTFVCFIGYSKMT